MADKRKTFKMSPVFGGINLVAEQGTLGFWASSKDLVRAEFTECTNWMPLRRGGIQTVPGFIQHADTGEASAVNGIYRFKTSTGTNKLLAAVDTDLYDISNTASVSSVHSSLTNARIDFETAGDLLVICDGTNAPKKYDGSTVANLGGSPPAKAKQSVWYKNRLFIIASQGSGVNSSYVYYSDALDPEAGYGSNFVPCDLNDGSDITAIAKFFIPGQLEPVILVGKEKSVGIITGDGSVSNPFTYVSISQDAGIPNIGQITQAGPDIYYFTRKGVSSFKTDVQDVNLTFTYLSENVRPAFTALPNSTLGNALAWYDPDNNRISFAVVETGTYANIIWHYDLIFRAWYKEQWASGQLCTAVFVDYDGTVYHGDTGGLVHKHGTAYKSFNGERVTAKAVTDYLEFGDSFVNKRVIPAQIKAEGEGNYQLAIATSLDNGGINGSSHYISLDNSRYKWGASTWTDNPDTYKWGGSSLTPMRFYPRGWFNNIRYTFLRVGANEPCRLIEFANIVEYGEFR